MNYSLRDCAKAGSALVQNAYANGATTAQTAIDTLGWDQLILQMQIGVKTDGTIAVALTECDTSGGTYTAVASPYTAIFTSIADADASANTTVSSVIDLNGTTLKRFLKVSATVASNAGSCAFGIGYVLFNPINARAQSTGWDKELPTPA